MVVVVVVIFHEFNPRLFQRLKKFQVYFCLRLDEIDMMAYCVLRVASSLAKQRLDEWILYILPSIIVQKKEHK